LLGLDAYNAQSVIEALSNLARTYNRTVILTIHQPRSGIVALIDELIVLARGRCVWSGPMRGGRVVNGIRCDNMDASTDQGGCDDVGTDQGGCDGAGTNEKQGVDEWLEDIGKGCPAGFNMADYLSASFVPRARLTFMLIPLTLRQLT